MSNKKVNFFQPEDFKVNEMGVEPSTCATIANRKLNELISTWPKVYTRKGIMDFEESWWTLTKKEEPKNNLLKSGSGDTHQAYLAFIEPVEKKECEHEVVTPGQGFSFMLATCKRCGAKLKAKWEVVK